MLHVEVAVKGRLDPEWAEWFEGLELTPTEGDMTLLAGELVDTSALYGLLSKLRDLGLVLVSLRSVEDEGTLSKM
jgi:hypothetical protein